MWRLRLRLMWFKGRRYNCVRETIVIGSSFAQQCIVLWWWLISELHRCTGNAPLVWSGLVWSGFTGFDQKLNCVKYLCYVFFGVVIKKVINLYRLYLKEMLLNWLNCLHTVCCFVVYIEKFNCRLLASCWDFFFSSRKIRRLHWDLHFHCFLCFYPSEEVKTDSNESIVSVQWESELGSFNSERFVENIWEFKEKQLNT